MSKSFGLKLKEIRKSRGLRLVDLQKLTGITPSFISQLERGICVDISVSYASKIEEALNLPDGFFGERITKRCCDCKMAEKWLSIDFTI